MADRQVPDEAESVPELTDHELRIVVLSARGCTNTEIAEQCFVSVNTVKTHVARILAKLNARNKVQAVAMLMTDPDFRDLLEKPDDLMEVTSAQGD